MDRDSLTAQMTELEDAFVQIIGAFPVYMRPPYLHHDAALLQAMSEMGYHIITAGIDTKDYENDSPDLIGNSLALFRAGLDAGGTIILAHDVHQQTVDNLVQAMLDEIRARGLRGMFSLFTVCDANEVAVTIGDCLGDLRDEWYRASR